MPNKPQYNVFEEVILSEKTGLDLTSAISSDDLFKGDNLLARLKTAFRAICDIGVRAKFTLTTDADSTLDKFDRLWDLFDIMKFELGSHILMPGFNGIDHAYRALDNPPCGREDFNPILYVEKITAPVATAVVVYAYFPMWWADCFRHDWKSLCIPSLLAKKAKIEVSTKAISSVVGAGVLSSATATMQLVANMVKQGNFVLPPVQHFKKQTAQSSNLDFPKFPRLARMFLYASGGGFRTDTTYLDNILKDGNYKYQLEDTFHNMYRWLTINKENRGFDAIRQTNAQDGATMFNGKEFFDETAEAFQDKYFNQDMILPMFRDRCNMGERVQTPFSFEPKTSRSYQIEEIYPWAESTIKGVSSMVKRNLEPLMHPLENGMVGQSVGIPFSYNKTSTLPVYCGIANI